MLTKGMKMDYMMLFALAQDAFEKGKTVHVYANPDTGLSVDISRPSEPKAPGWIRCSEYGAPYSFQCSECGAYVSDVSMFCPLCGEKLGLSAADRDEQEELVRSACTEREEEDE